MCGLPRPHYPLSPITLVHRCADTVAGQDAVILHPVHLETPPGPILGAASVHGILAGWRGLIAGHATRMATSAAASATVAPARARSATSSTLVRSDAVSGSTDPSCRVMVPLTRATRRRTSRTRVER